MRQDDQEFEIELDDDTRARQRISPQKGWPMQVREVFDRPVIDTAAGIADPSYRIRALRVVTKDAAASE